MTDTDSEILAMVYDGRALAAVRKGLTDDVTGDSLSLDTSRYGQDGDVHEVVDYALAYVLRLTRWQVDDCGQASAHIVTDHATDVDPSES